ncbi:MAG TPA: zinc ribbon domain-containing protein [Anaerolineales bacterium]
MRKWFALIALAALFLLPARVNAQNPVGFDTLDVSVWPEYDTPTVLVINKITLNPQVTLPVEITLRMPASVGKISAVAVGNTADTVSDTGVDYKFTPGGDYAQVTIKATARSIHVEYYDENLQKNGNQHQYIYEWLGDASVDNFHFELRQPLQSSNLVVDPALTNSIIDAEGFQFSDITKTGIKAGQKLSFSIKYQRDTDSPSTSFLKVQSSTPLDQTLPGQSTWTVYLPWVLGGLGLALLFVAGWVYWTSSRSNRVTATARKRHVSRDAAVLVEETDQVHCSQCGKRAQPGDRFCRACGARLRRTED